MPVIHMVWFKFNEGVSEERIEEHMNKLRALPEEVDVIWELKCGASFTDRAQGFRHGLVVTVEDRESLQEYLDHPAHVEVAKGLRADSEIRAVDLEG